MIDNREIVRRLLERDLVEWADDVELRLVWADLLQLDGDPLGRLVVLDHVAASPTTPAAVARRARDEAEALRKQLWPRLWDEVVTPDFSGISLIWQLGFVRELRIDVARISNAHTPALHSWDHLTRRRQPRQVTTSHTLTWLMPRLLRQPALRWLEIIRVETPPGELGYTSWMRGANIKNPCLREIHVGSPALARLRPFGLWEPSSQGEPSSQSEPSPPFNGGELANLRRLRFVSIGGELVRVPCCHGNAQSRAHFVNKLETRPLTSSNCAALGRALFDQSELVHKAAFGVARKLGARAEFLVEDLAWFLRPALGKKDPRPVAALEALAAIGPASAVLLPELLARPDGLIEGQRLVALLDWLTALGPAARSANELLATLGSEDRRASPEARAALARARRMLG